MSSPSIFLLKFLVYMIAFPFEGQNSVTADIIPCSGSSNPNSSYEGYSPAPSNCPSLIDKINLKSIDESGLKNDADMVLYYSPTCGHSKLAFSFLAEQEGKFKINISKFAIDLNDTNLSQLKANSCSGIKTVPQLFDSKFVKDGTCEYKFIGDSSTIRGGKYFEEVLLNREKRLKDLEADKDL